ncbi:MAG: hypothetical protein DI537_33670 [Stutzerimonas stutzeri]|nr:MAG: hypothetical protein DI537_33670 [Stutzerimonas stutzeri]
MPFIFVLDLAIGVGALFSSWLWLLASRQRLRRVSRLEEIDAADLNRIVIALNRTQILNSRAALTASMVGALAGMRFAISAST